ncbi:MAG: hypothetical protein ACREDP_20795, partial [Bradyrhizobium sp.]
MPRKSKSKTPQQPTAENPGANNPLPDEVLNPRATQSPMERERAMEESEIIRVFKAELGGTGFITFQRRHPPSGQTQFSHLGGQISVDGFSIANVASMYGGGDFIARARNSEGKFAREARFSVDHSIAPKNPMSTAVAAKPETPPVDVAAIIRETEQRTKDASRADQSMMQTVFQQQNQLLIAALQRPEPKGETAALVKLVEEMREDSRRSEERMMKMIQAMAQNQQHAAPKSLGDQLRELGEVKEVIRDIMGDEGGGDKDSWKEIVKDGIQVVGPIIAKHFGGDAPTSRGPVATRPLTTVVTA